MLSALALGTVLPKEAFAKSKEEVRLAMEIDDRVAEVHNSLAHMLWHDGLVPEAEKEYRRAIELNAGYATGHWYYGSVLTFLQRFEEVWLQLQIAEKLDPLSLAIQIDIGVLFYLRGQLDAATERFRKVNEMDRGFQRSYFWMDRYTSGNKNMRMQFRSYR